MSRNTWFLLPLLALVACSSGSSDDATATTATVVQATTPAPATTTAPTTVAPATTAIPATTEIPATTAAPTTVATVEQQVAFDTYGQEVTPITLPDDRGQALVIYSSAKGDFTGDLTSALVMVGTTNLALVWFEGTASSCGDGGLAIRIGQRPDGAIGWEIVGGLGTGDLAHATGSGVETAPNFVGTIDCNGPAPTGVVSTTLLDPTKTVELNPVAENIEGTTAFPVVPNPAQTEPPRMEFAQVNYADSTLFTAQLAVVGYPATRGSGMLSNTWLALGVSNDCTGLARLFIDNLLYEDFVAAQDVVEDATVCG